MFNVNAKEFIFLVMLALVVLGPEKLPEVFRRVGRLYSEVRRVSDSFQAEFQRAIEEPMKQVNETRDLVRESMDFRPSDASTPDDDTDDDTDRVDPDPADAYPTTPANENPPIDRAGRDGSVGIDDERAAKDQAEVERRIAAMERANAPTFATESDEPGSVGPSGVDGNGGAKDVPT